MYRQEEPDVNIDQALKGVKDFLNRFRLGGGGVLVFLVFGLLLVALAVWLGSGFYTVQPGEQAALRLFGQFTDTRDEGAPLVVALAGRRTGYRLCGRGEAA